MVGRSRDEVYVRSKDAPREIEIDQVRERDNAYVSDGD